MCLLNITWLGQRSNHVMLLVYVCINDIQKIEHYY